MGARELAEQLDKAKWVKFDPDEEIVAAWFGGHGINFYDLNGIEVHFINVGDFAQNSATIHEVEEAIREFFSNPRAAIYGEGP